MENPDYIRHNVFADYVKQAGEDSKRWFPDAAADPVLQTLCLAGEVGEVANLVKKVVRGTHTWEQIWPDLEKEMADVITYYFSLCAVFNSMNPAKLYEAKRETNEQRHGIDRGRPSAPTSSSRDGAADHRSGPRAGSGFGSKSRSGRPGVR